MKQTTIKPKGDGVLLPDEIEFPDISFKELDGLAFPELDELTFPEIENLAFDDLAELITFDNPQKTENV